MNYLDETILALKERIMLSFQNLKSAQTEADVKRQTDAIEQALREKLVESFKNGVEIGKKEAEGGKKKWKERK